MYSTVVYLFRGLPNGIKTVLMTVLPSNNLRLTILKIFRHTSIIIHRDPITRNDL